MPEARQSAFARIANEDPERPHPAERDGHAAPVSFLMHKCSKRIKWKGAAIPSRHRIARRPHRVPVRRSTSSWTRQWVSSTSMPEPRSSKIFSVASVALLPPPLIASVYGMNFKVGSRKSTGIGVPIRDWFDGDFGGRPFYIFQAQGWLD